MQNLEKCSYRTKRRRVVSAVSKLLSDQEFSMTTIKCLWKALKQYTEPVLHAMGRLCDVHVYIYYVLWIMS